MKLKNIKDLFHYRWNIPILSYLFELEGAKFVTLINRLKISRSVLSSTLNVLIKKGLVQRNPGYGHPLRPEYLLTPEGKKIAPLCKEIMKSVEEQGDWRLIQSKWAFPVLFLLTKSGVRFSELKSGLPPITSRALSEELKLLLSEGYIKRSITDDYPPAVRYELTPKASPFVNILN
jgi:DNA-binding HxlR family transcriptional regulator